MREQTYERRKTVSFFCDKTTLRCLSTHNSQRPLLLTKHFTHLTGGGGGVGGLTLPYHTGQAYYRPMLRNDMDQ